MSPKTYADKALENMKRAPDFQLLENTQIPAANGDMITYTEVEFADGVLHAFLLTYVADNTGFRVTLITPGPGVSTDPATLSYVQDVIKRSRELARYMAGTINVRR